MRSAFQRLVRTYAIVAVGLGTYVVWVTDYNTVTLVTG